MPPLLFTPGPADAAALGRVLLAAWLDTYPHAQAGIDEAWIREVQGHQVTERGIERWRTFLADAERAPADQYCRAVRDGADGPLLGMLCGLRSHGGGSSAEAAGAAEVSLGPMYLLAPARGRGVGSALMAEFLAWAAPDPIALWVTEYNEPAVRFYARHGFAPTGEHALWHGRLPNLRMVRPADAGR